MKKNRLAEIIEIIKEIPVSTQDELLSLLKKRGYDITQATVSRDIKVLRLIKTTDSAGSSRYDLPVVDAGQTEKFRTILRESVISVAVAGNIVVIRCYTGMANAAAAAVDSMELEHIVGTIAGDDTIFAAVDTVSEAHDLMKKLNALL